MDSIIKDALSNAQAQKPVMNSKDDEELMEILKQHQARIKVIGIGGGGNNTLDRISEIGVDGAKIIAINTDAQDLIETQADKKSLLEENLLVDLVQEQFQKSAQKPLKKVKAILKKHLQNPT